VSWIAVALAACDPGAFDSPASLGADAGSRRDANSDAPDAAREADSGRGVAETSDAATDGGGTHTESPAAESGSGAGGAAGSNMGQGSAAGGGGVAGAGMGGSGGGAVGGPDPGPAPCTHAADIARVTLSSSEVGELAIPSWVEQRTVAASTFVRDRVLLLFSVPSAFGMSGWGSTQGLLSSPPHLEEQGPFVPLFETNAVPADHGLTMGSAVPDGDSALIYFVDVQIFVVGGAGLARLQRNGNQAEVLRAAGALFPPPTGTDPAPWRPAFVTGALAVTEAGVDYVYVYGCQSNPNNADEAQGAAHDAPCRLARVPRMDAAIGNSYRYWTGQGWVADVTRAAIVIDHTAGGLSVSYNAYLAKYLAVSSGFWNAVVMRWADKPQGPWTTIGEFNTITATGGFGSTFGAIELPSLRDACQRVTYLSYGSTREVPLPDGTSGIDYSTRFVRVELRE
jgi:hypothetical protein